MLWKNHCLNNLKNLWHNFYVCPNSEWIQHPAVAHRSFFPLPQDTNQTKQGWLGPLQRLLSCLMVPIILEANPPVLQRHQVEHWPTFRTHVWVESKTEEWLAIPGTKIFKAKALTGYCGLNVEYLHRLTHLNTLFPVGPLFLEHCRTFRRRNLAEGNNVSRRPWGFIARSCLLFLLWFLTDNVVRQASLLLLPYLTLKAISSPPWWKIISNISQNIPFLS